MTGLILLAGSGLWLFLQVASLAILTGACFVLIWDVRYALRLRVIHGAAFNFLLAFCVFFFHRYCAWPHLPELAEGQSSFWHDLPFTPWVVFAVLEAVSFLILLFCIRESVRFRKSNLTQDVIRETVNLFPEGIAVHEADGTVLLTNLTMDGLSRILIKERLTDADLFWDCVRKTGEEQNGLELVRASDGRVWQFAREKLKADVHTYHQITASDVTERYRIIDELKENNEHLQDIQQRMKAVTELSGDMFVEQESATARAALHNQLGQVLLMGSYYLDHPESADANMVYMTTAQMNSFLLGEAEKPETEREDAVKEASAAALRIGVTVQSEGSVPENPAFERLLAQAVTECAANAVKHADGTVLYVKLSENTAVLTNNGRPPKGEIAESGGLLALRREVEAAGGKMTVESQPEFRLTIALPA